MRAAYRAAGCAGGRGCGREQSRVPRLLKMRVPGLAELADQLRFAPKEAARRHVERAEQLAGRVRAGALYDEAWIVAQVTGFAARSRGAADRRGDHKPDAQIPGEALLADLAPFIERLSVGAAYTPAELAPPHWLSLPDLCARWGVSRRTIERLRPRGLLGRRVTLGRGRGATVFARAEVERFEAQHAPGVKQARAGVPARPVARAKPAPARADARLTTRTRRLIHRALRLGVSPARLATRLRVSPATVRRADDQALLALLRAAAPARADATTGAPSPQAIDSAEAHTDMGAPGAGTIGQHIEDAQRAGWPDKDLERARALAYGALVARAHGLARSQRAGTPAGADLDRALTDLRWASRLKAELVRAEQLMLLRTIEVQAGRPLLAMAPEPARELLMLCLQAVARAADRHDPHKGGRLAAPAGLEVNRAVSAWLARRGRVVAPGDASRAPLPDWTREVCVWQAWTEPAPGVRKACEALEPALGLIVRLRHGWLGGPPQTCAEIGAFIGKPAHVVARLVRSAEIDARRHGLAR